MITIIKSDKKPQETAEVWNYGIEELDYLLTEHDGESFALYDNRLYEITEE